MVDRAVADVVLIHEVYEDAQESLDTCPQCGSDNIDKLQRITGYLVGTTERWNKSKLAELNDCIVHK